MEAILAMLVVAAVVLWRVRRWPLTRCWCCDGRGKHTKGRRARPCKVCGGSGYWTRWSLGFGRKKR